MNRRTENRLIAALLTLMCCSPVVAQVAAPGAPLTDTQAQALLQTAQSGVPLTTEQMQMLTQYALRKSQAAAATANQTPAQMHSEVSQLGIAAGQSSAGVQQAAAMSAVPAATTAVGADKKPGIIRIGLVMPKAQLGQGTQGLPAGEPLRSIMTQYLTGPSIEVTSIAALLPDQIEAEGKSKQCDYLVYSSFTQKKSGGNMGFLKAASGMMSMIPMVGGMASAAVAIAGAASAAQQAASLSTGITAKSQVVMEYHVTAPGGVSPVLSNSLSAKATADGEDIITPLIEQEATAIMAKLTNKK